MASQHERIPNGNQAKQWRASRPTVRWSVADATLVLEFIDALTDAGCAVIFNRKADGSELILGLYAGDERPKDYLVTAGEVRDYMAWLRKTYG